MIGKDFVEDAIEKLTAEPRTYDHTMMRQIFVSKSGDDNKDGLSRQNAIRSWKRVKQLGDGGNVELVMCEGRATLKHLLKDKNKKKSK